MSNLYHYPDSNTIDWCNRFLYSTHTSQSYSLVKKNISSHMYMLYPLHRAPGATSLGERGRGGWVVYGKRKRWRKWDF